jgi:Flp pilus assembly protein CpaB
MTRHRRRAIAFGVAALVLGLGAVSELGGGGARPEPPPRVAVVVASRPLVPGARVRASDLELVRMAETPAAAHEFGAVADVVGQRLAVALPAGSPVMDAELAVAPRGGDLREVAVRLDDVAGVPAGDLAGLRADLVVVTAGAHPGARLALRDVRVVATASGAQGASATLLVPAPDVERAVLAEAAGSLRLVVHGTSG